MSIPANYQSGGTENLRANGAVKRGTPASSPSGAGEAAGGTENLGTTAVTKRAAGNTTPSGGSGPTPPQSFNDGTV